MKIEVGKYYRTRDGRKTPKIKSVSFDGIAIFQHEIDGELSVWPDGKIRFDKKECPGDLIAEWYDAPAHIITHDGREYDLTALETPFGLLPEPVREALTAWPHGWEYWSVTTGWTEKGWIANHSVVVRAKPPETRAKCRRYEVAAGEIEHGTCVKRADGSIDWTTWEPEQ